MAGLEANPQIVVIEPLGYLDFTCLVRNAKGISTDSGGLQKEAYLAGVPCMTLRDETEWVETVESGWNRLVGLDADLAVRSLDELIDRRRTESPDPTIYGDGDAGERCVRELVAWADAALLRPEPLGPDRNGPDRDSHERDNAKQSDGAGRRGITGAGDVTGGEIGADGAAPGAGCTVSRPRSAGATVSRVA